MKHIFDKPYACMAIDDGDTAFATTAAPANEAVGFCPLHGIMVLVFGVAFEDAKMVDKDLRSKVAQAITTSQYKWRTAKSIARELDTREEDVVVLMRSSDLFVRAKKTNAKGEVLYTTSAKYSSETPILERFFCAGANTVSE